MKINPKIQKVIDFILQKKDLTRLSKNLSNILDSLPQPVFIKDQDHRWLFLNKAMISFMGIPLEKRKDFIGKTDYDFHPSKEAEVFWQHDDYVFSKGWGVNEESHSHIDGTKRTIRTSKYKFNISGGKNKQALIGFIQDITDTIDMKKALKYSEEKCQAILQSFPDKIFILSDGNTLLDSNPSAVESEIDNYIPLGIQNLLQPLIKKVITNSSSEFLDYPYFVNGRKTFYEIRIIPFESNKVIAVLRDISAAKEAERLAALNKSFTAARIDLRPIMTLKNEDEVYNIFLESMVQNFNIKSAFYFSYDGRQLLPLYSAGIDLLQLENILSSSNELKDNCFALQSLIRQKTEIFNDMVESEVRDLFTEIANRFSYSSVVSLPLSIQGKAIGCFILFSSEENYFSNDIIPYLENLKDEAGAALLHIQQQQEMKYNKNRQQKMEILTKLSGRLAHDFNNYLQAIIGFSELALEDLDEYPESARELTEKSITSAKKARVLVQQILSLGKKQKSSPQLMNINEKLQSIIETVSSIIPENIEIILMTPPSLPDIIADHGQVEQALINIIVNAREAITDSGKIIIESRVMKLTESSPMIIQDMQPGKFIVISITDNGHGIDNEIINNIFEPFFSTKEKNKGAGLGLTTAYKIVKDHKGTVKVKKTSGSGSTIEVYLPVNTENINRNNENNRPRTILLAEDDFLLRGLAEKTITKAGFKIITAKDGEDAINKYQQNRNIVDVVILDMVMPKLNGWLAYQKIKDINPEVKAVFMSGFDEEKLSDDFNFSLPPGKLLEKPFTKESLLLSLQS